MRQFTMSTKELIRTYSFNDIYCNRNDEVRKIVKGRTIVELGTRVATCFVGNLYKVYASSVESVWQGLKVFEGEGIDTSVFTNMTMDGIKRTTRKHGSIIGHQRGVFCYDILDYLTAKHLIYIPTYKWMIENKCLDLIAALREISKRDDIILLDYNTCTDVDSKSHPLSHASLVRSYVEGIYPYEDAISEIIENSKINLLQYNLNTNAQLNLFF